jgi:hypothetical protein
VSSVLSKFLDGVIGPAATPAIIHVVNCHDLNDWPGNIAANQNSLHGWSARQLTEMHINSTDPVSILHAHQNACQIFSSDFCKANVGDNAVHLRLAKQQFRSLEPKMAIFICPR